MRGIDWKMARDVVAHWNGGEAPGIVLCPLLADLDRLLNYLDEIGLRPGFSIFVCPECGDEHRWALIRSLMSSALSLRSARSSKVLEAVDRSLDPVRELYGGESGMRSMMQSADEFFVKVDGKLAGKR
jgi:hypothetical protein